MTPELIAILGAGVALLGVGVSLAAITISENHRVRDAIRDPDPRTTRIEGAPYRRRLVGPPAQLADTGGTRFRRGRLLTASAVLCERFLQPGGSGAKGPSPCPWLKASARDSRPVTAGQPKA